MDSIIRRAGSLRSPFSDMIIGVRLQLSQLAPMRFAASTELTQLESDPDYLRPVDPRGEAAAAREVRVDVGDLVVAEQAPDEGLDRRAFGNVGVDDVALRVDR